MKALWTWLKHELHEVMPPTIFFLIAFHIVVIERRLMLREYGLPVTSIAGATVGALLVAKVVLIADALPFVNRYPAKPLMYNIIWKTAIYFVAALLVHYLEHLVPVWWRSGDLSAANRQLASEVVWPHFLAIQLWLVVLLFVYCSLRELARAIGRDKIMEMFFGPRAASTTRAMASTQPGPTRDDGA
jgi:hypothetical protein